MAAPAGSSQAFVETKISVPVPRLAPPALSLPPVDAPWHLNKITAPSEQYGGFPFVAREVPEPSRRDAPLVCRIYLLIHHVSDMITTRQFPWMGGEGSGTSLPWSYYGSTAEGMHTTTPLYVINADNQTMFCTLAMSVLEGTCCARIAYFCSINICLFISLRYAHWLTILSWTLMFSLALVSGDDQHQRVVLPNHSVQFGRSRVYQT
jgi:hypothetical protein